MTHEDYPSAPTPSWDEVNKKAVPLTPEVEDNQDAYNALLDEIQARDQESK